jgi:hypothetical protein
VRDEIQVTRYQCDKPGCPVVHHEEGHELPNGFHGAVIEITDIGGSGSVDWYACRAAHIREAVEGALARAAEEHRG